MTEDKRQRFDHLHEISDYEREIENLTKRNEELVGLLNKALNQRLTDTDFTTYTALTDEIKKQLNHD